MSSTHDADLQISVGNTVAVKGLPGTYIVACIDDSEADLLALSGDAEDVDAVDLNLCSKIEAVAEEAVSTTATAITTATATATTTASATSETATTTTSSTTTAKKALDCSTSAELRSLLCGGRDLAKVPTSRLEFVEILYSKEQFEEEEGTFEEARTGSFKVSGIRQVDQELADSMLTGAVIDAQKKMGRIGLNLRQLVSTIGGLVWDSSLVFSAYLAGLQACGRSQLPLNPGARILELGAGLGVLGLSLSKILCGSGVELVMSDYDVEVLERLNSNIDLNCGSHEKADRPKTAMIDFRDFAPGVRTEEELKNLYGDYLASFDCIVGADIVYEGTHSTLSHVINALLRRNIDKQQQQQQQQLQEHDVYHEPVALIMLPDSRPGLQAFVDHSQKPDGGNMELTCFPISQQSPLLQRLRQVRTGLGSNQSFSLYKLKRKV